MKLKSQNSVVPLHLRGCNYLALMWTANVATKCSIFPLMRTLMTGPCWDLSLYPSLCILLSVSFSLFTAVLNTPWWRGEAWSTISHLLLQKKIIIIATMSSKTATLIFIVTNCSDLVTTPGNKWLPQVPSDYPRYHVTTPGNKWLPLVPCDYTR